MFTNRMQAQLKLLINNQKIMLEMSQAKKLDSNRIKIIFLFKQQQRRLRLIFQTRLNLKISRLTKYKIKRNQIEYFPMLTLILTIQFKIL